MTKQLDRTSFDDLRNTTMVNARTMSLRLDAHEDTIWRWSRTGILPKPIKVGENTTRWNVGEVKAALNNLEDCRVRHYQTTNIDVDLIS